MRPLLKKISSPLIVLFAMFISIAACKKDKGPTVSLATLTTLEISGSTIADAKAGGNVTSTGGASITTFGIVWSNTNLLPTLDNSEGYTEEIDGETGSYDASFNNLGVNKTYYVRAYATNAKGTAYGDVKIFVVDASENVYRTVKIGTQTWMLENLKTTKYQGGADIPIVEAAGWANLGTHAMSWYGAVEANKDIYGGLYNWYAVNQADPNKKLAPSGWRIPTVADWQTLNTNTANDLTKLGKVLKEAGNAHWLAAVDITATNSTHFTALPGGYRSYNTDSFGGITFSSYFWSAGENGGSIFHNRMNNNSDAFSEFSIDAALYKNYGFSVRCIKE